MYVNTLSIKTIFQGVNTYFPLVVFLTHPYIIYVWVKGD